MSKRNTTTKRLIEKANALVLRAPTIVQTTDPLYTADESVTLVRIVGNLMAGNVSATPNNTSIAIVILRTPHAVALMSTATSQPIYDAVQDILWARAIRSSAVLNSFSDMEIDVKGMRKLKTGDTIELLTKSTADAAHSLYGQFTLFLKES